MRRRSEAPDPALAQRIADCDRYHMAFDGLARTFSESLETGGPIAFEETFAAVEDTTRRELLTAMYDQLGPRDKLELMLRLTGDAAIQEFLKGLAEAASEYDAAMLKIRAEAESSYVLRPSLVPRDAELRIYLASQERVEALTADQALAEMGYDRSLTLRAIGDGTFKMVSEDFAENTTYGDDECFDVNDLVQLGTAYHGRGGGKKREKVIRPEEMLAVSCGNKISFLTTQPDYEGDHDEDDIVVICLEIDGEQVLPVPNAETTNN